MRIAIVGGGPRGVFAVERLLAHWRGGTAEVLVFDAHDPGVGAAYDPAQPGYLRLNVTSAVVGAGWPGESTIRSFDQWRSDQGERAPLDPFPPRARVGEYLRWVWRLLLDRAPDGVRITHVRRRVEDVSRTDAGWLVDGSPVDEVLLATGHESTWPGALSAAEPIMVGTLVPAVFPVDRWLGDRLVPPGSQVAIRGAALTFIDAVLALTEGRGGRFTGDWREGMRYRPSGTDPGVIWPLSRSGRWMDPKPQPGTPAAEVPPDVLDTGCRQIAAATTADAALAAVADTAVALGGEASEVARILAGEQTGDPTADLRRRTAAVAGQVALDASWALGHAWRGLYGALRGRFEGLADPEGNASFLAVAQRLERVAFGPPPVNAAKLLALIDAGIVDPASLSSSRIAGGTLVGLPGRADVLVDAVLPPPGVMPGSLIGRLAAAGVLYQAPGRRGVAVAPDASCLDRAGAPIPGLACIGRATEDVVIGNDTLNRRLHPAVDAWARRVAAHAAANAGDAVKHLVVGRTL